MLTQENLHQFITGPKLLLFFLTDSAHAGTVALETLRNQSALLAKTFYLPMEFPHDIENLTALFEKVGLPIALPNFSSGAQQEWCIQKLNALSEPTVLIIDHAHLLPETTLASIYELVRHTSDTSLKLHLILAGSPVLKTMSDHFLDKAAAKKVAFFQCDTTRPPDRSPPQKNEIETSANNFWSKHKIKTIAFIALIMALASLHFLQNRLTQWENASSASNPPAFTPPPLPKPEKLKRLHKPKPVQPSLPRLDAANVQKTAKDLLPPLPTSAPIALQTQNKMTMVGWPGEKIATTPITRSVIATSTTDSTKPVAVTDNEIVTKAAANYYTLQLIASPRRDTALDLQNKLNIANESQVLEKNNNGQTWYFLLEGKYSTLTEAKSALAAFQTRFPEQKPWVRNWS